MPGTNAKKETVRALTVSSKYAARQLNYGVTVPYIRISGKWLNRAGFDIGQKFTVESEGGKLILNPISTAI